MTQVGSYVVCEGVCLCLRVCREGWRVLGQLSGCCASSLRLPLPSRTAGSWTPGTCPLRSTSLRRHRSKNGVSFFSVWIPQLRYLPLKLNHDDVRLSFPVYVTKKFCSIFKNTQKLCNFCFSLSYMMLHLNLVSWLYIT